jgi:membrane associated rhomboid family serine protease
VLHVAFNMLAFVPIGASLERQLGSLQLAHLLLLLILAGDAFYLGSSYLLAFV